MRKSSDASWGEKISALSWDVLRRYRAHALVAMLVLAAIAAAAAYGYRAVERELTALTLSRRAAVVQLAAMLVSEKFERLTDIATSLATRVRFRALVARGKWAEAIAILESALPGLPFVERLFLTDVAGTLQTDLPALAGVRGVNFAERQWYRGVSHGWRPYVSPIYQRSAEPRLEVFAVAAPIRDENGVPVGILVLQIRAERYFLDWAKTIALEPGAFLYVVDSGGRPAPRRAAGAGASGNALAAWPLLSKLAHGESGVEIGRDPFSGARSVIAYAPVAGYGWGVIAQQPADLAFAARDALLSNLIAIYAVILVLFLLLGWLALNMTLERRRAEEGRRAKAELERQVAERTAQLQAANRELESFSYSVSHDLRAPLRAIDGFSRILEEDYGPRLDDEGRRLLRVVRDGATQMAQLISDLLEFSRLGRKPLAREPLDMQALVHRALSRNAAQAARCDVRVGDLPSAAGDAALLAQVWANLLDNAFKYSATRERPSIEIGATLAVDHCHYWVKDNGVGFDMRYADKLFKVFQRLHSAEEFPGTGVGLAIVRRVIERHGGRVWAESRLGEGACFHFTLPREETTREGTP